MGFTPCHRGIVASVQSQGGKIKPQISACRQQQGHARPAWIQPESGLTMRRPAGPAGQSSHMPSDIHRLQQLCPRALPHCDCVHSPHLFRMWASPMASKAGWLLAALCAALLGGAAAQATGSEGQVRQAWPKKLSGALRAAQALCS
jgi:hypothetical protein